jgi:cellobiose phosphorylase
MADLKKKWDETLALFQVNTPDDDVNLSLNQWNAYQAHTTFAMSRGPSIWEGGIGRGMGFRDSNQDMLGVMHAIPVKAKKLIHDLAKNQFKNGTAYHQFFRLSGEGDGTGYSDDALWIILSTTAYLKETGDFKMLNEKVAWADGGSATMYDHLRMPLEYTFHNTGFYGIPQMGFADWNDTLQINGPKPGVSVWVAQFFVKCARDFAEVADLVGKKADAAKYRKMADEMARRVDKSCWDGEWYTMAVDGWGTMLGSKKCQDGKVYLNTQTWAVISWRRPRGPRREVHGCRQEAPRLRLWHLALGARLQAFQPALGRHQHLPPGVEGERRHLLPRQHLGRGGRGHVGPVGERVQVLQTAHPADQGQDPGHPPGGALHLRPVHRRGTTPRLRFGA